MASHTETDRSDDFIPAFVIAPEWAPHVQDWVGMEGVGPTQRPDVWAELSGGTDSSSIVATAQVTAGESPGIAGTITLADELGSGMSL